MSRESQLLRAQLLIEAAELLDEGCSNDVRRDIQSEMLHSKSKVAKDLSYDPRYDSARCHKTAKDYKRFHREESRGNSVKDYIQETKNENLSQEEKDEFKKLMKDTPQRAFQKIIGRKSGRKLNDYIEPRKKYIDDML